MKLAIIGSYGHVDVMLKGIERLDGVTLAGVARWGPEDPMGFVGSASASGLRVHDGYPSMLDEVRPDVVGVFVPLYRLGEVSVAAAERGAHVFSEKPLATTLADLDRFRETARRRGVQVAACLAMRGAPAYLTIRQAVRDGRIGECIYVAAQKSYPFNRRDEFYKTRRTYGGSIPWVVIHALDYVSYCTGQDYVRVAAVASNRAHPTHPGMEDQGGVLAELSGGGAAVFNFDYLRPWGGQKRPWGDDRLRIAGTRGIIETRHCGEAVELMTPDATEMLPLLPARNLFAEFVAALRGEGPGLISTDESFRSTEVALKARDAQDAGTFVDV